MAITVTPNLTTIADCDDATGWSIGDVDTDLFVQGTACLGEQVKATTGAVFEYTLPSAIDLTGSHYFQWLFVAGAVDTKANGGYRIFLESSAGNDGTFYVGGSDTVIGGWYCFILDPTVTPDIANGTLDITNITKIGVQFKTITSIAGTGNNCFWDISRFGTGYNVTSLDTDSISLDDVYLVDDSVTNKYGVLSKSNGVYFTKGQINYGNSTSGDIVATINNTLMVFTEDSVASDFFRLNLLGSTGATSTLEISGTVIKGAGAKVLFDMSGTDSVLTMSGTTITNMADVTFLTGSTVSSSVIDGCDKITPSGSLLSSITIANTTESTTGALEFTDATSITNCSDITFTSFAGKYAVYIPATITGTITLDNFTSDGSGTDVYWAGTTDTLTINKSNGTNFTTWSSAGGTVSLVSSVSIAINVKDSAGVPIENALVYIDEDLEVVGEIVNTLTDVNGDVATSYSGGATSATVRVRKYGYKFNVGSISLTSDSNTNVVLITDPQQI